MVSQAQKVCTDAHRELKSKTKAEDIIWFKIDENTHQSIIIYSSEADAKEENAQRQADAQETQLQTLVIQW